MFTNVEKGTSNKTKQKEENIESSNSSKNNKEIGTEN